MKRIAHLDVLGETRRALRIMRRVEAYLVQQERATKRAGVKRQQNDRAAGELMAYGNPFGEQA